MEPGNQLDVGVVIVTHNPGPVLAQVLDALAASEPGPAEVVVVDSGSSSCEDLDAALADRDAIQLIRCARNVGFCAANNIGIAALAPHEYLLLLNPDVVLTPDALARLVAWLADHHDVGAVGPKLLAMDVATGAPSGRVDSLGIEQAWWGRFRDIGQGRVDDVGLDAPSRDVFALCAACVLCRMKAVESVRRRGEVLDESFFMYKEDIDLSLRLRDAGWRTVVVPQAIALHGRGTPAAGRRRAPAWVRRRSLANEWRLVFRPHFPARRRPVTLAYLLLKSVLVALNR